MNGATRFPLQGVRFGIESQWPLQTFKERLFMVVQVTLQ